MYFTQDDYRKIEEWLSHRTVKDSEFPEADPLDGTETFLILQDKKNKVIKLKDFINQDSEMKGYDIYNVSAELDNYNLSKFEAIDSIPDYKKKLGLIISYCTNPGNWNIDQFQGTSLDLWKSYGYWKNIHQDVLDLMGQPYGIATLNSDGKIDYADLEDIPKSKVGLGNVTNDAQVKRSEMGVANGVATLNSNGTVPAAQLPSYVDDVLEFNTLSALPTYGETGKIYVTKDTNLTYRWTGSQYTEISKSLALGETSSTAYAGNRGKENREALDSLPNNIVYSVKDFTSTNNSVTFNYGFNTKGANNKYGNSTNVSKTIVSATTTAAGVMSAKDKKTVDSLPDVIVTGSYNNADANQVVIYEQQAAKQDDGTYTEITDASIIFPPATSEVAGTMSAADKAKLIGIEEGAQVNSITSVAGKTGQVLLNKNDVGLDAVDNTSDEDKPLSYAARTAITNLSTNIETKLDKRSVTDIETLDAISNPDRGDLVYVEDSNSYYYFSDIYNWARIINDRDLDAKVDKVSGKQLSTNDFNNTYKDILDDPWASPISQSSGGAN